MSYLTRARTHQTARPVRAPRRAMGDFSTDIMSQYAKILGADASFRAVSAKCDPVAQAASAPLDSQLQRLLAGWKQRDDFYYVADMSAILQNGLNMISFGQKQLDAVDNKDFTKIAQAALFKAGDASIDYVQALNAAKNKGAAVVDAPGFKDWVVDAWNAASLCVYSLAYAQCAKPTIVSGVQTMIAVSTVFSNAVAATAAVVVQAGQVVYHATTGALSLLDMVAKYGKYAALGYGAYWLAQRIKARR